MRMLIILFVFALSPAVAQESGFQYPLIKGYGGVLVVDEAEVKPDPDKIYKVVIDLKSGPGNKRYVNFSLDRVARLINLHVMGGVPPENLMIVVVAHADATSTMLSDEKYNELHGRDNPNTELLNALHEAGTQLMICGQSVRSRELSASDLHRAVKMTISMLTTVTTLQLEGYAMLQF